MPEPRRVRFTVSAADAGKRLDQVLAANVPGLSRRKARVLLELGGVYLDKHRTKTAGKLLRAGQTVEAVLGAVLARATKPDAAEQKPLPAHRVIHEDEDLVVVEKPSGLLTAPTPESDRNNLAWLLARRERGVPVHGTRTTPPAPIFVVHRIDLETSGLLVFAKTPDANRELSERFRTHDIDREYLAVVEGRFPDVTTCDRPIDGRRAVTHFAIEKRFALATLLRARLETGRTHQIRIHTRVLGHPVLGDPKHGRPAPAGLPSPPRMALHATKLGFRHPATGAPMLFESPLPEDLAGWLAGLE